MTINLPRYSKDSPVDLVDGAYGQAIDSALIKNENVTEEKLSADVQAKLNKEICGNV